MAPRDAAKVQLDFPQLVADIISQLRLTGTVGLLEMSDQVTPVYIVAQRAGALSITTSPPLFGSSNLFDGAIIDPVNGTIITDTGPLPAGDYDLFAHVSVSGKGVVNPNVMRLEHRDAANAVTIASLLNVAFGLVEQFNHMTLSPIRYTFGLNERLRVFVGDSITGVASGVIGLVIVPTP